MINEKTWKEFKEAGLLWFINMQLHLFGWALIYEMDDKEKVKRVYPARCKFRGFSTDCNDKGYKNVSKYLKDNAEELYKESLE